MTPKAATKAPPTTDPVEAARQTVTDALARVAALEHEAKVAIPARLSDLRWELHSARSMGRVRTAEEVETEITALKKRATEITRSGGEWDAAQEAVGAAREALDRARNPLLTVDEATEHVKAVEQAYEGLRAEQAALPAQLREAVFAGDPGRQVELQRRSDELPAFLQAAESQLTAARRAHAEAMAAAAEPGSLEESRWKEVAGGLRRLQADQAAAAQAAVRARLAPVVRSVPHMSAS